MNLFDTSITLLSLFIDVKKIIPRHLPLCGDIRQIASSLTGLWSDRTCEDLMEFLRRIPKSGDIMDEGTKRAPCSLVWADLPCSLAPFSSEEVPEWNVWDNDLLNAAITIACVCLSHKEDYL